MNAGFQGQGTPAGGNDERPLVDDPDADGTDEADDGDADDLSPKTDVPAEDETGEPIA